MYNILNISSDILFDENISTFEYHTHQPYASSTLNKSDEIRIPIQQQDLYTLPAHSFIYLEGSISVTKADGTPSTETFISNNGFAFLFDEIRYELNGIEIDKVRNPGITSTLKGYVSQTPNTIKGLENGGWIMPSKNKTLSIVKNGNFNVCLPLHVLLGFAEDFKRILLNVKQELILIRSNTDYNSVLGTNNTDNVDIKLDKVIWKVPHVKLSDEQRLRILKVIDKNQKLPISFRSWDLNEHPALPTGTSNETWAVKTSSQLEKPRYVIVAFQTGRIKRRDKDCSNFDQCDLRNIKLFLNSDQYPYDDLNLDWDKGKTALLYEMYCRFQVSYYGKDNPEPLLSRQDFMELAPIVVIDCSKQSEAIKNATVDMRLEFEMNKNFVADTRAYCLTIHDRIVEYEAGTGLVRKLY